MVGALGDVVPLAMARRIFFSIAVIDLAWRDAQPILATPYAVA